MARSCFSGSPCGRGKGEGGQPAPAVAWVPPPPPPPPFPLSREEENRVSRRAFVILASASLLTACGFQPVYMRTASGAPGPAQRDLAAIYVNLIPDRPGQLLRQALQDRFEGASASTARRYDLTVSFWTSGTPLGIQPDTTVTRVRVVGNANFSLRAQDPPHTLLLSGSARAVDALNNFDSQLFAADLENETIQKRITQELAEQITLQLAVFFRKRAAATATG
jgi:LPS-assembly lipoprotein